MAVLDGLPGVEVTVVVDGKDLHEYQDADMEDDEGTITKYIEAVDNANFAIRIKVTKDATFHVSTTDVSAGSDVFAVDGVQIGARRLRKLKFNTLETVTEHGYGLPRDLERVKDLGKIQIEVNHETMIEQIPVIYRKPDTGSEGFISEKAIKGQAMTHSYSLDEETYREDDAPSWLVKPVMGFENPAAIFVFHYRSKASLKELMIIPRTPSPVPLEDRPINELSPEEMAELVLQLKAKVANTAAIKRERDGDNDNDNNSRARKRARTSASADPVHLELNDDDTFTEVAVAPKEKTIIALDD
ncbi:hypothetical protein KCU78_g12139, partial [Aureobasidium melanogenum]